MIQISKLCKAYGEQVLFENASFVLNAGERLGLVGRNGSGKSTLFKLILDEEHPDSGSITWPKGYRIGRLSQHLKFSEATIREEVCLGLPPDERDQTYRADIILGGLGFSESDMERNPYEFSGGFQIRINLAQIMLSEPNLLLLDEPTNYLDIISARWLEGALRAWKGELIVITHDRTFLDSVTTHTMLIYRNAFRKIAGGTAKLYEAIEVHEEVYEKTRLNDAKKRAQIEQFINRFRAKASKATLVQSKIKALERMEVKEELDQEDSLDFRFAAKPFFGKGLMELRGTSFGYEPGTALINDLSLQLKIDDRIGVIGKNGRGKSTLLRLIAKEILPQSGSVNFSVNTTLAYFGQTNIDRLDGAVTVEEEISDAHPGMHRTKIRNICGAMMFDGDKALKKIKVLSGGERSRVLLGRIIATPSNLLLLDEPTNHLDLESVEALKDALLEYEGALMLVTHNEMLLRELCTRLIVFQGDKPFVFEGGYDDFLTKIGWQEEQGNALKPSKSAGATVKRASAQITPENASKRARDIEKQIARLEARIIKNEEKEKVLKQKLEQATNVPDPQAIQTISLELHQVAQTIESAFEELEQHSRSLRECRELLS